MELAESQLILLPDIDRLAARKTIFLSQSLFPNVPVAHAGDDEDIQQSSAWADHALATLGRGATSVAELQQSAAAIVKECHGCCSQMTKSIAKIGCSGKFPNNAERDLFRLLELPVDTHSKFDNILVIVLYKPDFVWEG